MTAPERIWAIETDFGEFWWSKQKYDGGTEYIRADLAAVPAQVLETCGKCMGSGYGGHPDSGHLCDDCNGIGGVPKPDPRDEVIARLVEALEEGRRAIGEHCAPHDCYATGPLTGDAFRDLVQCPACSFIESHDAALAAAKAVQHD